MNIFNINCLAEPCDLNFEFIHIYLFMYENLDIMIIMGRVEFGGNDYIPPRGEASIGARWLALYCPTCFNEGLPTNSIRAYDTSHVR